MRKHLLLSGLLLTVLALVILVEGHADADTPNANTMSSLDLFNANNANPSPDFDGDGVVGIPDFLLFVDHFGKSRGDLGYDAKYDLDGNGAIGIPDFLIFVDSFGSQVPPSGGGGGGSSSPDLIVESPSVSNSTLMTGQSFTLSATVRNSGAGASASTTLRYYRSSDATISTSDTEVGTDSVNGLSTSGMSAESISLNAPSSAGTYYYGACVESVSGESNTDNNCSTGVQVRVQAAADDHSNTRSGATSLSLDSSRSGQIETGSDADYFRVQVTGSGTLTVYTTGSLDTTGELQSSSGSVLSSNDDGGSGSNFRIERSVSAGTYYIKVESYSSNTGSYTIYASFSSGSSGGGGGGGSGGACTSGLVVNPGGSCTYKGNTFAVSSDGWGIIIAGGVVIRSGNSINQRGTINGVQWNFYASRNSGSNSWTIHTAE